MNQNITQNQKALNKNEEIVLHRWQNDRFEWTPENTQKIISVIQALDKKVNEMYDAVVKTKTFWKATSFPTTGQKKTTALKRQ